MLTLTAIPPTWLRIGVGALVLSQAATAQQIDIFNAADLAAISSDLAGEYVLQANIDLDGITFDPIGSLADPFTGSLDGNGFTITNLEQFIPMTDATGLFAVASGATFDSVRLTGIDIFGFNDVGGLVGLALNSNFTSCSVWSGSVLGFQSVGGLVGKTASTNLTSCRAKLTVEGLNRWAGGLVGHAHLGTFMDNCKTAGLVNGFHSVGGLSGNLHASVAIDCTSYAEVNGQLVVGGLTGWMQEDQIANPPGASLVWNCTAFGDVTGSGTGFVIFNDPAGNLVFASASTGGLVGWADEGSTVWECAAYGDIWGTTGPAGSLSAGLIGRTDLNCDVTDSHAYGDVLQGSTSGGLIAWASENTVMTDCTANGDVIGEWQTGGLVGAFERAEAYNCHAHGNVTVPGIPNGHGDSGRPVAAAGGLVGYTFPSATEEFGSVIWECSASGNVKTGGQFTGGLVGLCWGTRIYKSFATGNVSCSDRRVGGLVGGAVASLTAGLFPRNEFSNCYARGKVTQGNTDPGYDGMVGGLIGEFQTTASSPSHLHRCYSANPVNGLGTVGGLVGEAGPDFMYHESYWDKDLSGQNTSAAGEGRTTSQMFMEATYVGWFFPAIWTIDEGVDYPVHSN